MKNKLFVLLFLGLFIAGYAQDTRKYDYKLIHGLGSNGAVWNNSAVKNYINNNLKKNSLSQIDYESINTGFIDYIASQKKANIESGTGDESILIGHSQGGLVSRSYAKQYGAHNISTIVSIGTPHLGANIITPNGMDDALDIVTDAFIASIELTANVSNAANDNSYHWSYGDIWSSITNALNDDGYFNFWDTVLRIFVEDVIFPNSVDYAADQVLNDWFNDIDGSNGQVDLSPGSNFLNGLNNNQNNEEYIQRFSIAGRENALKLYRLIGYSLFNNEEAFIGYIQSMLSAYQDAMAWNTYLANVFFYWVGEYLSAYNTCNTLAWDNYYAGNYQAANYWWGWADYYYYGAVYYDYEFQWQYYQWTYLNAAFTLLNEIPDAWDTMIGSSVNDGVVTDNSQTWPTNSTPNSHFIANGANHLEETNNDAVVDGLAQVAEYMFLRLNDPVRDDNDAPSVPTGLSLSNYNGHPKLTWQKNPEPDVNGYKIYQKFSSNYNLLVTVDKNTLSFTDNGVNISSGKFDPSVYYKITAFDLSANESDMSFPVSTKYDGLSKSGFQDDNEQVPDMPKTFKLENAYPNPFNPKTTITFSVPQQSFVSLKVYDVSGRNVAELVDGTLQPGIYSFEFNAGELSSGVYIYKVYAKGLEDNKIFNQIKRIVLIK